MLYFISAELDRPHVTGDTYIAPAIPLQISDSDRGYRFETRQPGATALTAGIVDPIAFGRDFYLTVYHPGTSDVTAATPVDLLPGAVLTGIDLTMSLTPTVHIRGKVIDASGQPVPNNNVFINTDLAASSRTDATGSFDMAGVPPGSWDVYASLGFTTLGKIRVEVGDRDVENVSVSLRPLFTMTGRLTIEGRLPSQGDSRFSLQILNNREGMPCCSAVAVQPNGKR